MFGGGRVFADNPTSVDYNVYVKPSLSISASTNTVSIDLNPNSKDFGIANLDVTVGTNNLYGYKLYMTTDNNATNLERDSSLDSVSDNIPTLSSSTTTSTFPANYWGYRINNDVGGASTLIDTTGTNFYPYVPTDNPVISSSTEAINEQTANLTFGAKIDYEKKAGLYELTLKFKALPIVTTYYMQDIAETPSLANTICTDKPTVVLDKRDEKAYTIRRINGDCWMVENLQFTGTTMDSTTSNISPEYTPENPYVATYYDLEGAEGSSSTGHCYGTYNSTSGTGTGDGYIYSCIHEDEITTSMSPIDSSAAGTTRTVWYNYVAASAGSIAGSSNTDPQLYDICPAGWRLPNQNETNRITDVVSFNPVYGGMWRNGLLVYEDTRGYWWGSNMITDAQLRDGINYSGVFGTTGRARYGGYYVRCIMKTTNINNLTFMQDFTKVSESDTVTGDNKKQQIINSMIKNTDYSLTDIRDTQIYSIKKMGTNNDIWMTRNIAIGCAGTGSTYSASRATKSLTTQDTNLLPTSSSWSTNSARSLDKNDGTTGCTTSDTSDCNSYNTPRMKCDATFGGYYNMAAASAGQVVGAPWTTDATQDVCPNGWQMPSQTQKEAIFGEASQFNITPNGGYYFKGAFATAENRSFWWTSTYFTDGSSGTGFWKLSTLAGERLESLIRLLDLTASISVALLINRLHLTFFLICDIIKL